MRFSTLFLFTVISFSSACTDYSKDQSDESSQITDGISQDQPQVNKSKKLVKKAYSIGDSLHSTDLRNFKYFGAFFKGRAIYYHNHQDTIFHGKNIKGKDLLICFFDNQIARLKYELDTDITNELMLKYGSFKIKPLDSLSRAIVKSGNILNRGKERISLQKGIKNYQLTWNNPSKQIVYTRYEKLTSERSFFYEERIPDYKSSMVYLTQY